jgi:hypothetical protein
MFEQFQDAPFAMQQVLVGIGAEAKGELGGWMRMMPLAQERGRDDYHAVFMVPSQMRSGGDRVLSTRIAPRPILRFGFWPWSLM